MIANNSVTLQTDFNPTILNTFHNILLANIHWTTKIFRWPDTRLVKRAQILILRTRFQRGSLLKFQSLTFDKTISFYNSLDRSVRLSQNNSLIQSSSRKGFPQMLGFWSWQEHFCKHGRVEFYSCCKATCDFMAHFWFHEYLWLNMFQIRSAGVWLFYDLASDRLNFRC